MGLMKEKDEKGIVSKVEDVVVIGVSTPLMEPRVFYEVINTQLLWL